MLGSEARLIRLTVSFGTPSKPGAERCVQCLMRLACLLVLQFPDQLVWSSTELVGMWNHGRRGRCLG